MMRLMTSLLLILGLAGCASAPPAPVDNFYRLNPVVMPHAGTAPVFSRFTLDADSLYAERPLVYVAGEGGRQLRQYHYHLWLYPPAQLVRSHWLASLGQGVLQPDADAPALAGRIVKFDRITGAGGARAVVALELRVLDGRAMRFSRLYEIEQAAAGEGVAAHVLAVEQALAVIYSRFLEDMRQHAPLPPQRASSR